MRQRPDFGVSVVLQHRSFGSSVGTPDRSILHTL
jgi:hypothetical protein